MKELYTSPEMKLLCFASAEKLASGGSIDFDDIPGGDSLGGSPEASYADGDVEIDLGDLTL